jgi:hypothetical protein
MRLAACAALLLGATAATATTPKLARLYPPGGQRGTTVEVELFGRHLDAPQEVLFYQPGVTVEGIEPVTTGVQNGKSYAVEPGYRVKVRFKIAADCPPGPVGFRLRTAGGLTEYHRFFVGPFPAVEEDEVPAKGRNDKPETATAVAPNTTVHGRMNDPTDVDVYRVEVKKGQRVSAEVECTRLGVERGVPDLHLTIRDPDGKVLAAADDSALYVQDPVLSVVAGRDGPHFVELRHTTFNSPQDVYRLHVGTFARPTAVYPAGGPAGADLKVKVLGVPTGAWDQTVRLPAAAGDFPFVAAADGVPAPSPNRLRVSPFPNVLEAEPNDSPDAAGEVATLPAAFNGIINKPGDVDTFRFKAKKGDRFQFRAFANALGSPVDPVIWVKAVGGKGAPQRATDSRPNQLGLAPAGGLNRDTLDPILEFAAPADGEYVLGVEDERGEGGADYVYRVEVRPEENAVHTYVFPEPENQYSTQLRQAINVPAGNRATVQVGVFATTRPFTGELELVGVNLPKGVTLHAPKITPGTVKVPVVFEAAEGAAPAGTLADLVLRPVGGKDALPGGYRQTVLMNIYGNNDYYLHLPITRLAIAVSEPAPFRVEVEEPKSALVQNGEMALKFTVHRAKGFDGPVTVQLEGKPNGVSTATPVTVSGDKTEGVYLLGAARNATAGAHRIALTAVSGVGGRRGYNDTEGRVFVSSRPFTLTVAEPHVEGKIARTSVERGKTATLVCKLTHLQPFEGKATATLARLPRGVELVEPTREITSKDKEVTFTLRATGEALVGNYQGVALDVTVTAGGQPVRQLSGNGILRVDAERGAPPKK